MSEISNGEKFKLVDGFIQRAGKHFEEKLGTKGPKESLKNGMGFTRKSSDGPANPGSHPVEFRPGASNIEAIETEERKKK